MRQHKIIQVRRGRRQTQQETKEHVAIKSAHYQRTLPLKLLTSLLVLRLLFLLNAVRGNACAPTSTTTPGLRDLGVGPHYLASNSPDKEEIIENSVSQIRHPNAIAQDQQYSGKIETVSDRRLGFQREVDKP